MRTGTRRPAPPNSDYSAPVETGAGASRSKFELAGGLQPLATLDFSGFDALNAANASATPAQAAAPVAAVDVLDPPVLDAPVLDPPVVAPPPVPPVIDGPPERRKSAPIRRRGSAMSADPVDGAVPVDHVNHTAPADTPTEPALAQAAPDLRDDMADCLDDDPYADDLPDPNATSSRGRAQRTPRRGGFVGFGRKVLGLDRPEKTPRPRRRTSGGLGEDDPVWLQGLDEPSTTTSGRRGSRRWADPIESLPTPGPAAVGRRRSRSIKVVDDVEITAAPSGFTAGLWLWVARVAIAVIFLAGVNQVFIKPFRTSKPAAAVTTLDPAGSAQAAARYVSDYLSFLPGRGPAQLAALSNDAVGSTGAALEQFSGTGYLGVEAVLPGESASIDATHSVVAVAVRIRTAMPPPKSQNAVSAPAVGADPGPVPAGWTDLGSRWITVMVPVQASGGSIRVSGEGPVFAGEAPQLITAPTGAQVDQAATTGTQQVASSLLTAYAASNLSYLAAPGVALNGLQGAVTFVSLTGWSLSLPPGQANPASGTGVGLVTWQLAGTDLHITQPYAIALTNSQGRWYGAALSPNPVAP